MIRFKLLTLWIFGKVQGINCDDGFIFLHVSNFIKTDKSECFVIFDWFAKDYWCVELRMGVEKILFLKKSFCKRSTSDKPVGKINFWVVIIINRLSQRVIWVQHYAIFHVFCFEFERIDRKPMFGRPLDEKLRSKI